MSLKSKDPKGLAFRLFRWHGQLCASRPWEVIFLTLTLIVCSLSMTYLQPRKESFEEFTSNRASLLDTVILTSARCAALLYTYVQFTRLRRLGCKYLLAIASIFTIIFSFGFSVAVITFFDAAFKQLNEALPFFFLFIDIPKACTLAKFALSSADRAEVVGNIGDGLGLLGPSLALDTITMALVMGVGMLSGIGLVSCICSFSCMSILANYLAFVSFYPACLAIMVELARDNRKIDQVYQLAKSWNNAKHEPNLVLQKVKIIMSTVLICLHTHTIYTTLQASSPLSTPHLFNLFSSQLVQVNTTQQTSISDHYWYIKEYRLGPIITAVLAGLLIIKYFFVDADGGASNGRRTNGILKFFNSVTFMEEHIDGACDKSERDVKSSDCTSLNDVSNKHFHDDESSVKALKTNDCYTRGRFEGGGEQMGGEGCQNVLCNDRQTGILERFFKGNMDSSGEVKSQPHKSAYNFTIGEDANGKEVKEDEACEKTPIQSKVLDVSVDSSSIQGSLKDSQLYEPIKCLELMTCDQEKPIRSLDECVELLEAVGGPAKLTDHEVVDLVLAKKIAAYRLETVLEDFQRGVSIRRKIIGTQLMHQDSIANLPYTNYDYKYVHGACCENVIGYIPVPVGVAGPLLVDGNKYHVPMATTEGCLVASANRGCRALFAGGGVKSSLLGDGMTRAPLVSFSSAVRASEVKRWLEGNFEVVADVFDSTSRFARLQSLKVKQASRNLYIRFVAVTGDAMGMNMLSKGAERALLTLQEDHFPDMKILSLSSNLCTDKKPSAINWIDGRGKSIVCEAVVPGKVVRELLKTSVAAMVDLNIHKNLVGSSLAGSVGGSNAHAANIVTAIFIATGQDPAQNICSSNCLTMMEPYEDEALGSRVDVGGKKEVDLYISCTMPSLEVGTVGGGTILPPQAACLEMLGVRGAHKERPGENACSLARVICSMVMAGELSLMASLTSGDLVKSHLKHNRSSLNMAHPPQCIPI